MHPAFKRIGLAFFLVSTSVLFWVHLGSVLYASAGGDKFWSPATVGIFVALFTLYGFAYALIVFLVTDDLWAHIAVLAGVAPYVLALKTPTKEGILMLVVLWVAMAVVREWVARENATRIEISVEKALPGNLKWALTGIALAVAVAFYLSPAAGQLKDVRMPRDVFQKLVEPLEFMFLPHVESFVRDAGQQTVVPIPSGLQDAARKQLEMLNTAVQQQLARPFAGADTATKTPQYSDFSNALFNAFNAQVARIPSLPANVTRALALSLALALFFTVKVLSVVLGWIIIMLTVVAWNVLRYVGFVRVGTVQVEKEKIEL